jgi:soluble lytic murein transglycosylase-like protein
MANRRQVLRGLMTLVPAAGLPAAVHAGRQIEEPLGDSVRSVLSSAVAGAAPPEPVLPSGTHRRDYERWMQQTNLRLLRYESHPLERQEFLQTLWYEARRAGLSLSLVLGLVQVESAFRKFAVSQAGARGYMQVMPFWSRLIGDGDESRLFQMQTNLRFGSVILRHYLDAERGDLFLALGRYNGSRGQAPYPQAVLAAQKNWQHEVD